MKHSHRYRLLAAPAVAALGLVAAAQQQAGGSYRADQATSGQALYDRRCAGCHLKDLSGSTGPGLAGQSFLDGWGSRPASEFFELVKSTMPQGGEGSLTNEEYVNIVAYILQANGHSAGEQELRADSAVLIGAGGDAGAPPQVPQAPAPQ